MNTDKAYLLGLIIGGGIFGNAEDAFRIKLPYKKWGSYEENPQRAGQIAGDILRTVGQVFRAIYNVSVQYETTTGGNWTILCEGDTTALKADLTAYGIACEGEVRQDADISRVVQDLVDDNLKRRFIAGLADTIGSMAKSHRRFTDEVQILSFEMKGFNFTFVCNLCRLLYSVNCIPDQILWNHPNFHCGNDTYYPQWNKGFKLRIPLDQYARFGAFAFRTKAESSQANRSLQHQSHTTTPCPEREINVTPTCVHAAENDTRLPACIRGGHFIHNRHVCTVMGCEHAPYDKIAHELTNVGELVNPFPILSKKPLAEIDGIIAANPLFERRQYTVSNMTVVSLYNQYQVNDKTNLYGTSTEVGYPIAEIMQAIAYIIANNDELTGTRPKGYDAIIARHIANTPELCVEIRCPDLLTPLVIVGNGRGALVGANNSTVYARLVSRDADNPYKLRVRPITEEDLRNA
ncbi:MAG: hypothetical protein LBD16_03655 [Oscillospiraceae bacterium]|jgi:hypothetical protein|nr:hypothetical protein [Oscillospiraceae bacterium]